jgi:2-polyprenyl-3-methyl-5-hydroxy-6-metoxy-1,4-benzoquinol methylase
MLHHAQTVRPRPNIRYQRRDLREVTPDRDGRFDLVLSAYALHHVDRLGTTLRGIRDLVAPGGQVILIDNVDPRRRVPRFLVRPGSRPRPGR